MHLITMNESQTSIGFVYR